MIGFHLIPIIINAMMHKTPPILITVPVRANVLSFSSHQTSDHHQMPTNSYSELNMCNSTRLIYFFKQNYLDRDVLIYEPQVSFARPQVRELYRSLHQNYSNLMSIQIKKFSMILQNLPSDLYNNMTKKQISNITSCRRCQFKEQLFCSHLSYLLTNTLEKKIKPTSFIAIYDENITNIIIIYKPTMTIHNTDLVFNTHFKYPLSMTNQGQPISHASIQTNNLSTSRISLSVSPIIVHPIHSGASLKIMFYKILTLKHICDVTLSSLLVDPFTRLLSSDNQTNGLIRMNEITTPDKPEDSNHLISRCNSFIMRFIIYADSQKELDRMIANLLSGCKYGRILSFDEIVQQSVIDQILTKCILDMIFMDVMGDFL